ncbi:MAG: dihydrofolate reductase family protein [Actinomycetota bacterium]|nr:dihydrofolate reductase family protein [Actinomycetota bacterium]
MRKLTLWQNVSLDGYIAGNDEDIEWLEIDEELHEEFNREGEKAGAFVYGRRSYEVMLSYWPTADTDPSTPEYEKEFSRIWKAKPKVVLSRTLEHADWETRVIAADAAGEIAKLKRDPGGELMMMGGSEAPSALLREGLIDELRLYVSPFVLGDGLPLFTGLERPLRLKTIETRNFGSGVVLLRHEVLNG